MSTPGLILKLVISETRLGGHLMSTILEWILISKRSHVLVPKRLLVIKYIQSTLSAWGFSSCDS